ncbi:hypothetical protein ASG22_08980 [Chryseobacterium sp. Leaf405]|uniref:hypothetical protein n=1 Tax=Chryseobacterium sp. Leaf405 TaxID=1736367 RepID=UPI000702327E|nr:hypothetical protein [Chryseobacterium sp. Leaf405]KQT24140.1 hypothetical protein ASG22_08980 [Chryseobacterium sp. Leaf405]
MKHNYRDILIQNLAIIIGGVITGLGVRLIMLQKGADEFTANSIFWVINFVVILLYLAFVSFGISLIELYKRLKNKKIADKSFNQSDTIKQEDNPNSIQIVNATENLEIPVKNNADTAVIRKIQQEKKIHQDQEKLQFALNYTKQKFALYISDKDLDFLCDAVASYSRKESSSDTILVETKNLSTTDLYHFGWNIWNHFRPIKQERVAEFLKATFQKLNILDVGTIKSHLKDSDTKDTIIKLEENLTDYK